MVEVTDEHQRPATVDQDLLLVAHVQGLDERIGDHVEPAVEVLHRPVEVVEEPIAQVGMIDQRPLPPGVLVRKAVAFARKIDPLGVAELIAYEIQIPLAAQGERNQPDHLVQGDAAIDDRIAAGLAHVPVHVRVHQPKGDGLVAYQRLVVTFGVGDVLFALTAVEQHAKDLAHAPVLVAPIAQHLDPVVGDAHGQTIVEPQPTFVHRAGQPDHTRGILGNGDHVRANLMGQLVGQL